MGFSLYLDCGYYYHVILPLSTPFRYFFCFASFIRAKKTRQLALLAFPTHISLIPAQHPTRQILNNPRLKEILLFLQVHDLAHPRERVGRLWTLFLQANLAQAAVSDEIQIVLHNRCVHAEYAAGHGVAGVFDFQLGALLDHLRAHCARGTLWSDDCDAANGLLGHAGAY